MDELGMFGGGTCLFIFTGHGCLSGQHLQNSEEGGLPNLIGWGSEEAVGGHREGLSADLKEVVANGSKKQSRAQPSLC